MVNTGRRATGGIIPRNYGLMLDMPGREALFVSPLTYMIAQIALETSGEIRTRLTDWAQRHSTSLDDAVNELRGGVEKKEGTKDLLNYARRSAKRANDLILRRVKHYGGTFTAEVKSRSGEGYRTVTLREPLMRRDVAIGYPGSSCECPDHIYGDTKSRTAAQVCAHLAIPEVALALDERMSLSREANITGLAPRERQMRAPFPTLPFTLNTLKDPRKMTDHERAIWQQTTDAIMDYFVEGKSQYELNGDALENPALYSSALVAAIKDNRDRAEFKVIRQTEETRARSSLTNEQDRRYGAVTTLLGNISRFLTEKWGYAPAGYCREFVGTPWQTVARRFEPLGRGPVYSVVVSDEHPPLIISRTLGEKAGNWHESYDPVQRDTLAEKIGISYSMNDDVTRRQGTVTIKLPDKQLQEARVQIPANLQDEYTSLRNKIGQRAA